MLYLWGYRWDGTMKKGFTLVELLAVITILGILATVSSVAVFRVIETQKQALLENQIKSLEDTAVSYVIAKKMYLGTCESVEQATSSCYVEISVNDLVNSGYFENKNGLCSLNGTVRVYKVIVGKNNKSTTLVGKLSDNACHY